MEYGKQGTRKGVCSFYLFFILLLYSGPAMKKDFGKWHDEKSSINENRPRPFFYEGEVWWCSLGVNVGYEEDGKSDAFERPVVIFRKFNKEVFWGLPVTSQDKSGRYYFHYDYDGKEFAAILSQIRLLDAKRLRRRILVLSQAERNALDEKFKELLQ